MNTERFEDLAPPVLQINDVAFRYGERYPWLFKNMSFGIDTSTRAAIVGPNGVGKSTLISLIIGDLEPTSTWLSRQAVVNVPVSPLEPYSTFHVVRTHCCRVVDLGCGCSPSRWTAGEIVRNRFLRIGKYSQHFVDILPMDVSPVEYLQSSYSGHGYQEVRNLLGTFGLGGHAHTIPIRDLSGGQKARVVFASLSLQNPHILFLDEPTNHLDIESVRAVDDVELSVYLHLHHCTPRKRVPCSWCGIIAPGACLAMCVPPSD